MFYDFKNKFSETILQFVLYEYFIVKIHALQSTFIVLGFFSPLLHTREAEYQFKYFGK